MNKLSGFYFGFIVVLLLVGCGGAAPAPAGSSPAGDDEKEQAQAQPGGAKLITAAEAHQKALPEGEQWAADSFLVDVYTSGIQADGKSNTWYVTFYSPARQTGFMVTIRAGKVDQAEEKKTNEQSQIEGDWVDSPQAARVAVPKCEQAGQLAEPKYFISLNAGRNGQPAYWRFNCLVGEDKTLVVYVDALTGEFQKTGKAGIGW